MKTNPETTTYMTSQQVSHMLGGICTGTLLNNAKRKILPNPIRIGGRLLWKRSELMEALESSRETFEDA